MKIVIEGAGEVGTHLARMLREESNNVTVIDNDEDRIARVAANLDVETICGSPTSISVLKSAGVGKADLFIAVYPYTAQEVNLMAGIMARKLGAAKVVARVNEEECLTAENRQLFKDLGVDLMIYPEKSSADEIVEQLRHGLAAETMEFARGKLQIAVFKVDENCRILDLKLSEFTSMLTPEESANFRVIAINRSGKTIIPDLSTKFIFGDILYTVSTKEGSAALASYLGKSSVSVRSVMIFGGGAIARMVAASLSRQDIEVKIIDSDRERCISLTESLPGDVMIINGDGRNSDFLFEEGISSYDAFLALTESDETNVLACVVAKKFGVMRTIAEVENIEYIRLAEEMGVDSIINKKLIMAGRIFKFTLSSRARYVRYTADSTAEIIEYTVAPGCAVTKAPLRGIVFPKGAIVAGVTRGADAFIAVGDTHIEPNDKVTVFAQPQSANAVDKLFK